MKHSCRAANLRAILDDAEIRPQVAELLEAFEHLQGEDRRGTRLRESMLLRSSSSSPAKELKPVTLEDAHIKALGSFLGACNPGTVFVDLRERRRVEGATYLSDRAFHVPSCQVHGVTFRSSRDSSKDSNIVFWANSSKTSQGAGRILKIFSYTYRGARGQNVDGTYLFVTPYEELSAADAVHDHYRAYPYVGGRLYYEDHLPGVIITPEQVVSHFARTPLTMPGILKPCVHVLSLDKVGSL